MLMRNIVLRLRVLNHSLGPRPQIIVQVLLKTCKVMCLLLPLVLMAVFASLVVGGPTYHRDTVTFYKPSDKALHSYNYTLENRYTMPCGAKDRPPLLVILTLTHARNAANRRAIRRTWGSVFRGESWPFTLIRPADTRLYFVLGRSRSFQKEVKTESRIFRDILYGNFQDDAKNEVVKLMLALKWLSTKCPKAKYVMVTSDKIFLNVPYVLYRLTKRVDVNEILGQKMSPQRAERHGDYRIPQFEFPFNFYPDFLSKDCLVMNTTLALAMYKMASRVAPIPRADVYFTGILPQIMKPVVRLSHQSVCKVYPYQNDGSFCDFLKMRCLYTKAVPRVMYQLWEKLKDESVQRMCGTLF